MEKELDTETNIQLLNELAEIGLYFVDVKINKSNENNVAVSSDNIVKLSTGEVTIEQLELILNHLPIDITFVDQNNEVRYFSNPKHRIFPRSTAIIGRKVQNCHPPESVDIVNKIIYSFKNSEKDQADFWFHLGDKFVFIRYFAVRDRDGNYKGVLEVSQEIQDIQKIEGNRKLLDW